MRGDEAEPGWYRDDRDPGRHRFWDGARWEGQDEHLARLVLEQPTGAAGLRDPGATAGHPAHPAPRRLTRSG